jgi:hypothetical protein
MMRRSTRFGRDDARVLVWRGNTLKMNENADTAEIAEAYEENPVAAATEFGAEFRDDLSGFIAREAVERLVMGGNSSCRHCLGRVMRVLSTRRAVQDAIAWLWPSGIAIATA